MRSSAFFLFRGQRESDKEWMYGDITHHDGIVSYVGQHPYDGSMVCYDLIPETIGLYIGKDDIDGQLIFPGDVIEWDDGNYYNWPKVNGKKMMPRVVVPDIYTILNDDWMHGMYIFSECKILGNIYDTPELIEERKYHDCQSCCHSKIGYDAHQSYLYCELRHGDIDKRPGLANYCDDYKE